MNERPSARLILLDRQDRLFLFKVHTPAIYDPADPFHGPFWVMIGGLVDPGEDYGEAAVREAREETGLTVKPIQLVDVFYRAAGSYKGTHALIAVVYLCERIDGTLTLSHEHLDARYWPIEAVTAWHANHREYAVAAHALWKRLNAQHKT